MIKFDNFCIFQFKLFTEYFQYLKNLQHSFKNVKRDWFIYGSRRLCKYIMKTTFGFNFNLY